MSAVLEWGWAGSALEEGISGDLHVVAPFDGGALLVAIDGLGHGPEAAAAAHEAERVLVAKPEERVEALLARCHEALRGTRGVAMTLASFDARASEVTCIGVGNVEGVLLRAGGGAREAFALRGGVVGYQLPALRPSVLSVARGDIFILATDGVRWGFASGIDPTDTPQILAEAILARHAKGTDDALVVVARYLGLP
jgi:phosphoserine phosphatase RsbX